MTAESAYQIKSFLGFALIVGALIYASYIFAGITDPTNKKSAFSLVKTELNKSHSFYHKLKITVKYIILYIFFSNWLFHNHK